MKTWTEIVRVQAETGVDIILDHLGPVTRCRVDDRLEDLKCTGIGATPREAILDAGHKLGIILAGGSNIRVGYLAQELNTLLKVYPR